MISFGMEQFLKMFGCVTPIQYLDMLALNIPGLFQFLSLSWANEEGYANNVG